jgi:hypothetical protein
MGDRSGCLNVPDDFNREGLGMDVDLSLPAERVVRSLLCQVHPDDPGRDAAHRPDLHPALPALNLSGFARG